MTELADQVNEVAEGTPEETAPESEPSPDEALEVAGLVVAEPEDAPAVDAASKTEPEKKDEPEPSKAEPQRKPDHPLSVIESGVDETLFTPEALATPDGVAKARDGVLKAKDAALDLQRRNHSTFLSLEKRERRFKGVKEETLRQKQANALTEDRQRNDAMTLLRGDTRTVLDTLGRITGRSGLKFLEEMNLSVGTDGNPPKESAEVSALNQKIEALERRLQERDERVEQHRLQTIIDTRKQEIAQAAQNPGLYPRLADIAKKNAAHVGEYVAEIIVEAHQQGNQLTDAQALQLVEKQLQEQLGAPPAAQAEPERGNGAKTAEPRQAQSPPLGTQIEPAATTQQGERRSLSEAELDGLTAEQLPADFFHELGLM